MAKKLIKYPLDITGKAKENFVSGEPHVVPRDKSRAFAPLYGPFYTNSLVVRLPGNTQPLEAMVDYRPIDLDQKATLDTGLSVSAGILILNRGIGSDLVIDYQVVGGPFSLSADAIQNNLDALDKDSRGVKWGDIYGKPVRFPPAPHLHDAEDLYGMEYLYEALEELRKAVLQGDIASHDQIYDYIDRLKDLLYVDMDKLHERLDDVVKQIGDINTRIDNLLNGRIAEIERKLDDHIRDKNNPHGVDKSQVGLSNVANYPVATNTQALDEKNANTYLTPSTLWHVLKQKVLTVIDKHITDKNNPHGVTKAQVGLSNVLNYPMATTNEAIAHTSNERYMSPLTTFALIDSQLKPVIASIKAVTDSNDAHVNNRNNPHGTTKAHVGLGQVENYPMATDGDAVYGSSVRNKYASPYHVNKMLVQLRTSYIEPEIKSINDKLNGHINNRNNPHGTTKAHVGLSAVENYGMAADAEAVLGTSVRNKYTAPYHINKIVAQLRTSYIEPTVNTINANHSSHVNNRNNPHGTTKGHVGLGNVPNYPQASDNDARAGNSTTVLCTPKDVRLYHTAQRTISTADPSNPGNYAEGHVWWKVKN